jgi:hypothetical protein
LAEVPESIEELTVEPASVRAFRDLFVFQNVREVATAIAKILNAPEVMEADAWSAKLAPTAAHLSFEYESLHLDRFSGPKRLPALTASWLNQNYTTIKPAKAKLIDQELQLHREPFDGFVDLAAALNIPMALDDLNKRSVSEFVLASPVDFDPEQSRPEYGQHEASREGLLLVSSWIRRVSLWRPSTGMTTHMSQLAILVPLRRPDLTPMRPDIQGAVGSKKYHDWPPNVVARVYFVTYRGGQARAGTKKIGRLGTRSLRVPACDREEGHGAGS